MWCINRTIFLKVCELILHIKRSIEVAHELAQTKQREEDELYNGFFGLFKAFWSPIRSNDEFSLQERLKVPEYLQKSLDNLQQIFEVGKLLEVDSDSFTSSGSEIANDFRFLTPAKVRERVKHIKYEGDPDLHPVRSTEVTFLVRMLYQLAVHINEKVCILVLLTSLLTVYFSTNPISADYIMSHHIGEDCLVRFYHHQLPYTDTINCNLVHHELVEICSQDYRCGRLRVIN